MPEISFRAQGGLRRAADFDLERYRHALTRFPTGVAVVTAKGEGGRPIGLTVNSFTSVSLAPALVLWCLRRESSLYPEFSVSEHFAVNVLADDQRMLAAQFASRASDRFDGVRSSSGLGGCAVLADVAASFECEVVSRQMVGDHLLLIGEVAAFSMSDSDPLVMHSGGMVEPYVASAARSKRVPVAVR